MFVLFIYFRQTDNLNITYLKEGQILRFSVTKVQFPNEFGALIFPSFQLNHWAYLLTSVLIGKKMRLNTYQSVHS